MVLISALTLWLAKSLNSSGQNPLFYDDSFSFTVPDGTTLTNIALNGNWTGDNGGWVWDTRTSTGTDSISVMDSVTTSNRGKNPFMASIMPLAAGDYFIVVSGIGGFNHSPEYAFTFDVEAVPIPQPSGCSALACRG